MFPKLMQCTYYSNDTRKAHKLWDKGRRCAGYFLAGQTAVRIHWILWCILQLPWLHNAYQFNVLLQLLPFDRYLKGQFWDPNCVWGQCYRVGIRTNRKPNNDFILPVSTNVCAICRCLAAIPMSSYALTQFGPPLPLPVVGYCRLKWSKIVPIEMSSLHSHSTSIHIIFLSCAVWPQFTTRQTDRRLAELSEQAAYAMASAA